MNKKSINKYCLMNENNKLVGSDAFGAYLPHDPLNAILVDRLDQVEVLQKALTGIKFRVVKAKITIEFEEISK